MLPDRRRYLRGRSLLHVAVALIALAIAPGAAPAGRAQSAVITLLHINDVHEMDATNAGTPGGLARVATVLDEVRRSTSPVLVTLAGDFLSPSAIGTARLDGEPLAGRQAVAVLNLLGVQIATLGNHEFDVPETAFRMRIADAKFALVSSNVTDAEGKPFPGIATSIVRPVTVGGRTIRLGFIGLTIDFNRKPWVRYQPMIESAQREVTALSGKVDAILALTHQTLASDQQLVTQVRGIDAVLGGHEHENWILRRGPDYTPIIKADANGKSAAIVTMTFPGDGGRPTVTAALRPMDEHVARQPAVQAEIDRWTKIAFDAFRKDGFEPEAIVATVPEALDGRETTVRNRPGNLTDLIAAAIAHEAGTPLSILNGGSIRVDDLLGPGALTQYDIIRTLPFGGTVLRVNLDGALLRQVLDAGVQNQGSGGYLHWHGITRDNGSWIVDGAPLDDAGRYSVGMPEFLLTGGESRMAFLTRSNPLVHDVVVLRDIRQALIAELKRVGLRGTDWGVVRPVTPLR